MGDLEILSLSFILNSQVSTRLRGQKPSDCDRCPTLGAVCEPILNLAPRLARPGDRSRRPGDRAARAHSEMKVRRWPGARAACTAQSCVMSETPGHRDLSGAPLSPPVRPGPRALPAVPPYQASAQPGEGRTP